jgi:hypothetical protein
VGAGFAVVLDHFEPELVILDLVGDSEQSDGVAGDAAGDFAESDGLCVGLVDHDFGFHSVVVIDDFGGFCNCENGGIRLIFMR